MWEQFWHDAVRNLGPVYFLLGIGSVVIFIVGKRLEARKVTRLTYMLSDGGLNSVRVTLDAQLSQAERQRILSAHAALLSTYASAFDHTKVAGLQPERRLR
jgi:hypothetical protein